MANDLIGEDTNAIGAALLYEVIRATNDPSSRANVDPKSIIERWYKNNPGRPFYWSPDCIEAALDARSYEMFSYVPLTRSGFALLSYSILNRATSVAHFRHMWSQVYKMYPRADYYIGSSFSYKFGLKKVFTLLMMNLQMEHLIKIEEDLKNDPQKIVHCIANLLRKQPFDEITRIMIIDLLNGADKYIVESLQRRDKKKLGTSPFVGASNISGLSIYFNFYLGTSYEVLPVDIKSFTCSMRYSDIVSYGHFDLFEYVRKMSGYNCVPKIDMMAVSKLNFDKQWHIWQNYCANDEKVVAELGPHFVSLFYAQDRLSFAALIAGPKRNYAENIVKCGMRYIVTNESYKRYLALGIGQKSIGREASLTRYPDNKIYRSPNMSLPFEQLGHERTFDDTLCFGTDIGAMRSFLWFHANNVEEKVRDIGSAIEIRAELSEYIKLAEIVRSVCQYDQIKRVMLYKDSLCIHRCILDPSTVVAILTEHFEWLEQEYEDWANINGRH